MATQILEPTPEEKAYSDGWKAYHSGTGVNVNPYSPESETALYESWIDGWLTGQQGDLNDDE